MSYLAEILNDSIADGCPRLTTFRLRYPSMIHQEHLRHRALSFSVSSGRAIPSHKQLASVAEDPAMPASWPREKKGMSGGEEIGEGTRRLMIGQWLEARDFCLATAERLAEMGLHKSVCGRLLKPWAHYEMICTSCAPGWLNFFALRCHAAADPTIRRLAVKMADAYRKSTPETLRPGDWHLPYVNEMEMSHFPDEQLLAFSVARCARVSYLRHGSDHSEPEKDREFHDNALKLGHWSVFEHQARVPRIGLYGLKENPDPVCGNLPGWIQYRQTLRPNVHTEFDFSVIDREFAADLEAQ